MGDGRSELADRDHDGVDASVAVEDGVGHLRRQPFQQLRPGPGDHVGDQVAHGSVVDRGVEVIGDPRSGEVDLDVEVDLTAAGITDDLDATVDYGAVCDLIADVVAGTRPQLLERLAAEMADAVLDCDGRIDAVVVAVRKLRPPVPHDLATSGVRIRRSRRSTTLDRP